MNELERQVATLLKDAPGEPPMTLDLAISSAIPGSRRRALAPLIAAAVVLAVIVPVVVLRDHASPRRTPASSLRSGSTGDQPTRPRQPWTTRCAQGGGGSGSTGSQG